MSLDGIRELQSLLEELGASTNEQTSPNGSAIMKKSAVLLVLPILLGLTGCSKEEGTITPLPPDRLEAPATITATTLDDARVNISWSAVTEPTFVGYLVFLDRVVQDTTVLTSYQYTGLTGGTLYTFGVATLGELGYRSYHTEKIQGTAVHLAPADMAAEIIAPDSVSVRLTWSTSGEETISNYRLYRGASVLTTVIRDSLGYTDTPGAAGTYLYSVAALDTLGFVSARSDTVTVILP